MDIFPQMRGEIKRELYYLTFTDVIRNMEY